jgi:hypothetical protein
MSEQVKKTIVEDRAESPQFTVGPAPSRGQVAANAQIAANADV